MALSTTTKTPTGWAADAAYANYQQAQQIAAKPFQPYPGNMLAGWDQGQQQGYNAILNGGGIGQGAQAQAQHAALLAAQAGAQQVQGRGYSPAMQGVMNTAAANAGAATPWTVTNTSAANAGSAVPWAVTNTAAASAGPAQQMQAASMERGSVRDIVAKAFTDYDVNKYMNPYINTVVNNSLADLSRQNDIVNNQTNARAAAAGAFGGSRQAVANTLNNENFIRESGNLSGRLRHQGYDTASGLIMQDANRDFSAQQSNQQMDWNVGSLNTSNAQQAGLQNMLAGNQMAQYNAGNQQQANMATSAAHNSAAAQQAMNANQMAQYNASNQQQALRDTAAAHNAAAAQQAMNANQMAQYNAGNQQSAYNATAQAHNAALANQAAALNRAGEFGADVDLRGQLANQSAHQNNINSRITAANALNGMGMDEQTRAFNAANAAYRMGENRQTADQRALDEQYRQWAAAQGHDRNQLAYLQQALGGYSSGTAETSPYYNNTAANVLAGGIGAGQLLANAPQMISGAKDLWNAGSSLLDSWF